MSDSICRWGFLGAAAIARKNWKAIRLSGNGRVAAVASRSVERAQCFIDECAAEAPQSEPAVAMGSYEELIRSDDIDAVYIPLPTGIRKPWVIAAAEAGKHVLCEKPVGVNTKQVREMLDACRAANVQFMDGVMFDHSQRIEDVSHALHHDHVVGKLRRINTHFSFCGDDSFLESNIRANHELEPHGCLGDLGWYCIRFTLWAAGLQMPERVSARTITAIGNPQGQPHVPGEFSAELQFGEGLSATFYCSFLTSNQQTAVVSGDRGHLTIDDFVLPFYDSQAHWATHDHALEIENCRWNFNRKTQSRSSVGYASGEPNSQEVQMVRRLATCALHNKLDLRYPELTLKTQLILDACRRSAIANGDWVNVDAVAG
ncbi:1,5-anhydro-D-fructose reductase [Novipirellula galeiformis]|uniref:1,5-anhydro-D-fructose reductase n=1 Tax=Novipirellula galeiformis TaxID=2528004 RepID=A0A5C6CGU4_9BACT|nr:Gfo/Idh/MocA family oxidoreductase [Novipirellula galeiformis]TWU24133.1 1,5-anhydro-D-fructose reductase [Novipirellula galeiformis]